MTPGMPKDREGRLDRGWAGRGVADLTVAGWPMAGWILVLVGFGVSLPTAPGLGRLQHPLAGFRSWRSLVEEAIWTQCAGAKVSGHIPSRLTRDTADPHDRVTCVRDVVRASRAALGYDVLCSPTLVTPTALSLSTTTSGGADGS
jgi:hypothetical protein